MKLNIKLFEELDDETNIMEIRKRIAKCTHGYWLNRQPYEGLFECLVKAYSASGLMHLLEIRNDEMNYIRIALNQLEADKGKGDITSIEALGILMEMRSDLIEKYLESLENGDNRIPELIAIRTMRQNIDMAFVTSFAMEILEARDSQEENEQKS